jgi:Mrp family chromosome partitioning ATPase
MRGRQGVHVLPVPDYWKALRRHSDLVVVDAPAAERSQGGLTVSRFMDDVVLVVAADEPDVRAPAELRDELVAAGARCSGLFVNRVQVEPPAFLRGAGP